MHSLRLTSILPLILCVVLPCSSAQTATVDLTQPQDYVLKRVSSFDRSGGNADYRQIPRARLSRFSIWTVQERLPISGSRSQARKPLT